MTRRGKIARLPQPIREQVNRRLENGAVAKQIAQWLQTLPEVNALMAAEFDGQPVNENNLSNWKLGGYRDWQAQQEALEAVCRFNSDAAELAQAGGAQLAGQLVLCLTARLAVAMQQPPEPGDDPAGQLERLRRLSANLVKLRKSDDYAQWVRIQREKLDLLVKKYKEEAAARKRERKRQEKEERAGPITQEGWEELERHLHLL